MMTTQLVLDAFEQAIWARDRAHADMRTVVAHRDRGPQYTSIRYTERLAEVGIAASAGSVGDSYDNALAETINGLLSERIRTGRAGPALSGGPGRPRPGAEPGEGHSRRRQQNG